VVITRGEVRPEAVASQLSEVMEAGAAMEPLVNISSKISTVLERPPGSLRFFLAMLLRLSVSLFNVVVVKMSIVVS